MSEERRRYYRIEDKVSLAWQQIDASAIDARLEDFWANEHLFSIRNNYNFQIEQHIADRHQIETRMPELARYLAVLENQIARLTDKLIIDEDDSTLEKRAVNLSAQGISFHCEQAPAQDTLVELKLKLLPSSFRLVIIARVVMPETLAGDEQSDDKVSLNFEHIHEADREILVKHIHGKQMESLSKTQES